MKDLIARIFIGLNQMLTETDNETQDLFRWLAVLVVPFALGMEVYSVVFVGDKFDLEKFGLGIGAIFVSVGGALALKPEGKTTTKTDTKSDSGE